MPHCELGKGIGEKGTVNVFGVAKTCKQLECPFIQGDKICHRYNGDGVIIFARGVTRESVDEVNKNAPCMKPS